MDHETEGVIKFRLDFRRAEPLPWGACSALEGWRRLLFKLGLIGLDPSRYGGLGFGNVSLKLDHEEFLISGTQTGSLPRLNPMHYCVVKDCDLATNRVIAHGPLKPSSEALNHGAAYQASRSIRSVLHVHSPLLWENAELLGLPATDPTVAYGTPAMAEAVNRLLAGNPFRVIAMAGHRDGIIATGESPESAALLLIRAWIRSIRLEDPYG